MLGRNNPSPSPLKTTTLTETIINLESVNPIDFFGVNNNKFDLLKKKFPLLKILSRGTQIKLSGAPEQIDIAKEMTYHGLVKFLNNAIQILDQTILTKSYFLLGFPVWYY